MALKVLTKYFCENASEGIEPYYYSTSNSSGEIDFMIQGKTSIIPLEREFESKES